MTQDIARYTDPFPGPLGAPVYYRTYSEPQVINGRVHMQTWEENARRNATFLGKLGELTPQQVESIYEMQCELIVTPPGRVLWAAKEEWVNRPGKANYLGLFNCVGIQPSTWDMFGHNFLLLMMGCGVGSVLSEHVIAKLPPINAVLPTVTITHLPGEHADRPEETTYSAPVHCKDLYGTPFTIYVGDSKEGWVDSYVTLLKLCSDPFMQAITHVNIDLGHVRPNNSTIKGFGGTANPVALASLYGRVMGVFGGACGRQITAYEACLLLNWAAVTVVAGNIRRSARWDGYDHTDTTMVGAKDNLWSKGDDGTWVIDPKKDALRMSNISAIMHTKPTLDECTASIQKQYDTGEGALYYAPAALVRCNVDLLRTVDERKAFEHAYTTLGKETGKAYLRSKMYTVNDGVDDSPVEYELDHRMSRYGANPCCLTGDTMILTQVRDEYYSADGPLAISQGQVPSVVERVLHQPINNLIGKEVKVWDGEQWVITTFQLTGTNQEVFEVLLEDGSSITATIYHKFFLEDSTTLPLEELKVGSVLMRIAAPYDKDYSCISRSSTDKTVVSITSKGIAGEVYCCYVPTNNRFTLTNGVIVGNCEILGKDFVCSLSQVDLSRFDVTSPTLWGDINEALDTASIIVCSLLKRGFDIPELQVSREMDPIVAVTLNGVFDFMVNLWGDSWLKWWMAGCPEWWTDSDHTTEAGNNTYGVDGSDLLWDSQRYIHITKYFLESFRNRVRDTVTSYCTEHKLPIPNRYTAMQPSGSKSCLTGGTTACYTPKASHWIRRITLRRDHPVALASIDYGYKVSTACKDSNGVLLDDPYDDRVSEWLIEIPDKCTWSEHVTGAYDVANAPITSQWYLTMACQKYFVTHNTSSTLEINKDEVGVLANLIYHEIESGGDYVSSAVFARDYQTMPRMPYEPITKEQYNVMMGEVLERRTDSADYKTLVEKYYGADMGAELGPTVGCDGDSCTLPTM
jgi:hypothetical protein